MKSNQMKEQKDKQIRAVRSRRAINGNVRQDAYGDLVNKSRNTVWRTSKAPSDEEAEAEKFDFRINKHSEPSKL